MNSKILAKSVTYGTIATLVMLGMYFAILTFVSGWKFTLGQFGDFWYFVIALASGFGIQIGLYVYLKNLVHKAPAGVLATSGTTSTVAMISCCAHYLVNILPILGVTGLVAFTSAYQIQLFWFGLFFNLVGIAYIANQIIKFKKHEKS
ncbi:MAG: hypothetical protein US63_C0019G0007 [Candidatus Moranbacteria bacterium GW2011_GWC2_37_8]|nr:MAG: hypothetical protein US63_C0019G0007 [Candidatus Moranbacteria bacterium GW2011_GWC2_37_8]KKQ62204.1 MAG: hypothetical protein US82_C0017G0011 [Parcubacteria group bacterium GW2011_GWC1_38_22]KKQ79446.1 MAG: hypothetical protein UT03_C0054G0009 [Candidatus Moranbacteria bacterium GW2011_GWD2_38_7]